MKGRSLTGPILEKPMEQTNRVTVHAGALEQAITLLRWWADDGGDETEILEMIQQSKEAARDLERDVQHQAARTRR